MSRTSPTNAIAELYGLITTPSLPTGVTAAYPFEPAPGQGAKPVMITVAFVGMTAIDYLLALRIYVTSDVDAQTAQDTLASLVMTVDGRMTSGFGPSNWDVDWDPELAAFVATNIFQVGREDDTAFR